MTEINIQTQSYSETRLSLIDEGPLLKKKTFFNDKFTDMNEIQLFVLFA